MNVRWYLRYSLSYRNLEEMMLERGVKVDHTTIYRWVQAYSPGMDKRCRRYLQPTNDSWRGDETYVRIKGVWGWGIDEDGNLVDVRLSKTRDMAGTKAFFAQAISLHRLCIEAEKF